MSQRIQGLTPAFMKSVITALHGPLLGPEPAYAYITFEKPETDDPKKIYSLFTQHVSALRFAENADIVVARLKQDDAAVAMPLIAMTPLPKAIERMHHSIRTLAAQTFDHIINVEAQAIIPLTEAVKKLKLADGDNLDSSWKDLHQKISSNNAISLLEETNTFLHFAGDVSHGTPHFQLVREFLHNISNGLLPLTVEQQLLKEYLSKLPRRFPDTDEISDVVEALEDRMNKWYKAYASGIIMLHRYFIIDALEKTNRQIVVPAVERLAQAAAAVSPTPLKLVQLDLQRHEDPATPLREQRDNLYKILHRIALWHDRFGRRAPRVSCTMPQTQQLIEQSQRAISFLSRLARLIPTTREEQLSEVRVRRFYTYVGKFKAAPITMAKAFDGWDSRREAHMELPY